MNEKILLLLIIFCLLNPSFTSAAEDNLTLFVLDQVSLMELSTTSTPNLDWLINQGAVGLMNTRTSGTLAPEDTYLTIGAGCRADGTGAVNYTFNRSYLSQSDDQLSTAAILNMRFEELVATNQATTYQAQPGALGTKLKATGRQVAVIGNSDYLTADGTYQFGREAAVIGMDQAGQVSLGDVSTSTVKRSTHNLLPLITDQQYLVDQFAAYRQQAELVIVESGDPARVAKLKDELTTAEYTKLKEFALQRADKLLGRLLAEIDLERERLLVIIPTPAPQVQQKSSRLTLTILAGRDVSAGLLTSATTKRLGVITNLDIAPTVLSSLGIKSRPAEFIGHSITSEAVSSSLTRLKKLADQIKQTFTGRPILIKGFILLQIIVLMLAAVVIIFSARIRPWLQQLVEYLLLMLLVIPGGLLLFKYFVGFNLYLIVVSLILLSLIAVYLLKRLSKDELTPILWLTNLIAGLLIIDLWQGAELIKTSVLGYSPVIGARYYGLGNEFMGVLIGAVLIGTTGLIDRIPILERRKEYFLISSFLLTVITIGHAQLGANFGGLITALAACGFTYGLIKGYLFNFRQLLVIIIILGVVAGSLICYDALSLGGGSTHIGRTVRLIREEGVSGLVNIITRKLRMNLKLLRWTIWTKVIIAFVITLAILFKYPVGVVKNIITDYSYLHYGFGGVICGSIVTMLVNDSGVVATATLLLYPVITLVYLVIRRIELVR
ncbi:MAG: hypothetical protein ACQEQI_00825 [Bacillota bacterium]